MPVQGEEDAAAKEQEQNLELRRALNDAYGFVEGQKLVQTFSAITFEELMDQQIERLSGASTTTRPNALVRIDKVEADLIAAVAKIKSMPDDAFSNKKDNKNVNTPT